MVRSNILYFVAILIILMAACRNRTDDAQSVQNEEPTNTLSVLLPKQCTYEILIDSLLSEHLTSSQLFLIYETPYFLLDSVIFPIIETDTSEISMYIMPDNICPDAFCFAYDDSFWFTKGYVLGHIIENDVVNSFSLPLSKMKVTTAGKQALCVYGQNKQNSMYELYYMNLITGDVKKLLSEQAVLNDVIGTQDYIFVALDSIIYIIGGEELLPIFNAGENISSMAFSTDGIFYATNYGIGYFNPGGENIVFAQQGAKQLLSIQNKLYIWYNNGALCRISNTEYFKDFIEKLKLNTDLI